MQEEFETAFWPNVPTKIGKGKAREAYVNARKKVDSQTICAGLLKYRAYEEQRATASDYRPLHPATWLNQERWDDEVAHKETPEEAVARLKSKGLLDDDD